MQKKRGALRASLVLLVLFAFFGSTALAKSTIQPDAWDAGIKLPEAADMNPDPRIVEVKLEAAVARVTYAAGQSVEAWTYNGGIPGPLIRTRVGDRLIVHFTNKLPKPTTVHWHGLRVPIEMDGVPGISQPEVQPGESFKYDFIVPDAGLFWYHPHVMSSLQVGFGLYGALLVEDPTENIGVADELVLVLSDIGLEDDGASLASPYTAGAARLVFGLEGNHVLVNGRERPKLTARAGAPQRWRIVNSAKTRYFLLDFVPEVRGATPFTLIGRDGGLQEHPTAHDVLLVAPGERVDVIVTPQGTPGTEILVRSIPHNRGYGSEYLPIQDVFTIAIADLPRYEAPVRVTAERSIEPITQYGATHVNIDIRLVEVDARTIEYRINGSPVEKLQPVQAKLGETQIWTVINQTRWSHPIHLHGFFFQVIDEKGPVRPLAWRDTVDVPFEQIVRFIVRYDDRAGTWMYHCHILDHAEGGLMGMVQVGEQTSEHPKHSHDRPGVANSAR